MRWPIQTQLLLPMLSVVVLAILLASAASAYFGARWARRQQDEALSRVVAELTVGRFPLTGQVMRQLSGLSGAEFALVDSNWQVKQATLPVNARELAALSAQPPASLESLPSSPAVELAGRRFLSARVRVQSSTNEGDWLVVLYPEDLLGSASREAMWPPLIAGAASILVVVAVTTLLARRFVEPIRRLGRQAEGIARGDFEPLPLPDRNDEFRDLAVSMNTITERLAHYEQTVRASERLRTLEQLGAGMAHQLRNWATGARMAMELHQRKCPRSDDESLSVALRQLTFMECYVQRFLNVGRPPKGASQGPAPRERIELAPLIEEALSLIGPACEHGKVQLRFTPTTSPAVAGNADQLHQALINLLLNAIEAASQPANAAREVAVTLGGDEQTARITLCDSGPGPSDTVRERLFEPFVSDKPEGTGLGLAVARQIVEEHRGTLSWSRQDDRTCFCIELPAADTIVD